jgi:hypothetical protein
MTFFNQTQTAAGYLGSKYQRLWKFCTNFIALCVIGVKVKLSLCLTNYAMKTYGRVDVWIHVFLNSALDGGEWSASCPCRFSPGETTPSTHWMGAGLDDMQK